MAIVKAVRATDFVQYDGTNSSEVLDLVHAGWPFAVIDSEDDGVLTMSDSGTNNTWIVNETEWFNGNPGAATPDADFQANYIVKE